MNHSGFSVENRLGGQGQKQREELDYCHNPGEKWGLDQRGSSGVIKRDQIADVF